MSILLIFVPGHLCGPWLYAPQMQTLPGAIIADVARDDTIGAMAARVLATAPARFAIAGLSMGGMVAMEVMAQAPERVVGACLMDTDPTQARPREIEWRNGLLARGLDGYIAAFVDRFFLHDPVGAERLVGDTARRMRETPAPVAAAQARALDTRRNMVPLIAGYSGPIEIIVGAEDRVCPPKLHTLLANELPDARLSQIPSCGHIATLERPDAVSERLLDWIARCADT